MANLASKLGQIGQKCDKVPSQNVLKLILNCPIFVPFGANLTQFGCQIWHHWLTLPCWCLAQSLGRGRWQQVTEIRFDWFCFKSGCFVFNKPSFFYWAAKERSFSFYFPSDEIRLLSYKLANPYLVCILLCFDGSNFLGRKLVFESFFFFRSFFLFFFYCSKNSTLSESVFNRSFCRLLWVV